MKISPPAKIQKKVRYFQGIPVREARGDILVKPTQSDINKSSRHDPENCAYAVCIRRMLETSRVFVYTRVAYVETLDEAGRPVMERYQIRNSAAHYIQKFDKGEYVGPGGFVLHKPIPSYTLDAKARYGRNWVKANPDRVKEFTRRQAERAREKRIQAQDKRTRGSATAEPKAFNSSWRSGTGCVRFLGTFDGNLTTRHE